MYEDGDVVTLAHPRMKPKYLNGTKVRIIGPTGSTWGGQFASELITTYKGEIVEMLTPRPSGRFRVGGEIQFPASLIERTS